MPLCMLDELTSLLVMRGYICEPRTHWCLFEFCKRLELLVMSSLYMLGHGASFQTLQPLCHLSKKQLPYFSVYSSKLNNMCDEFIGVLKTVTELKPITRSYENVGLPGCCDSMDVVHVRCYQCPTGYLNRAKGKESFPTLFLECVTDFNWRIMGVYGPHFGSQNDK